VRAVCACVCLCVRLSVLCRRRHDSNLAVLCTTSKEKTVKGRERESMENCEIGERMRGTGGNLAAHTFALVGAPNAFPVC
jgi:hypothetical protein